LNEAIMAHPAGESESDAPRLNFDRRLKLEFHGSSVTSDAGLLPFRELDDVLGLMVIAGQYLADGRTGRNARHDLIGMLRQSVFGRLAGYKDVNDADRLGRDPAMRWIVGGRAATKQAASTSQMGRFETEWLANNENLVALTDLSGRWIDRVHMRLKATDGRVCVQMSAKMARSAPRPMFGLPEVTEAVRAPLLSCWKAVNPRIYSPVRESSGESRLS
jgi:Transposase DDE domain group 1